MSTGVSVTFDGVNAVILFAVAVIGLLTGTWALLRQAKTSFKESVVEIVREEVAPLRAELVTNGGDITVKDKVNHTSELAKRIAKHLGV